MAAISLPFAASATRRAPNVDELSNGYGCGDADLQLFDWLAWWETGQIANVIAKSGLTVDDTDILRLAKAIRSQAMNYRAAGGTANTLTLDLDPDVTSYAEILGTPLAIKSGAGANSGAMTLNVDGVGAVAITWPDGTAMAAGDWPASTIGVVRHDGTAFRLMAGRSPTQAAADQSKVVPVSFNATWSQALTDSAQTDITSYTTLDSNLDDANFSAGILTVGPRTAGLWMVVLAGAHPTGNSEFLVQIQNAGTGGTAIAYNSSRTTSGAPFVTATGILRRANGDKIRGQARQISGGPATCTGRVSFIRLGA